MFEALARLEPEMGTYQRPLAELADTEAGGGKMEAEALGSSVRFGSCSCFSFSCFSRPILAQIHFLHNFYCKKSILYHNDFTRRKPLKIFKIFNPSNLLFHRLFLFFFFFYCIDLLFFLIGKVKCPRALRFFFLFCFLHCFLGLYRSILVFSLLCFLWS